MNGKLRKKEPLTKNQSLVMDALAEANGPLSAYTILDQLREHGFRAPLQVYRALDKLMEIGRVHRLESLNAFVACCHPAGAEHETMAFMICGRCRQVEEITDERLSAILGGLARSADFTLQRSTIELRGKCRGCRAG